ncbi:hypothetical protein [Leptospira santarosai]|uniref:hypothetical protein n=1 Tax=Leptospira santarosai TaxID=28183 RepID=UPI0018AD29D1|nr:hypothetical protein [Leptospira santarosai]
MRRKPGNVSQRHFTLNDYQSDPFRHGPSATPRTILVDQLTVYDSAASFHATPIRRLFALY